jgi:hypothetical protein
MRKVFKMNQIDESTYVNPEQTEINNSAENYIQKQNQKLKEEIDFITNSLNDDEDNIPAIPEKFFKDIFLPLFLGEPRTCIDPVTNNERPIDFTDWLRICQGSYSTYVKVVDNLDEKTTLFLVPPLYNTKIIKMKSLKNNSENPHPIGLANVFIEANERKYNSPILAETIIKNETVKLINDLDEETIAKDKKLWNDILERYNLIDKKSEDKKSEDKKTALDYLEWDF